MATLDFKPLRRTQEWTVNQKQAIQKFFNAINGVAPIDRDAMHTILAPELNAQELHCFRSLRRRLEEAYNATDTTPDLNTVLSPMPARKKRVLRALALAVASDY